MKRSSLSAPERPGTSAPGDWRQFRNLTQGNAPRSTKARRGHPATSGVVFPEGAGMDPLNEAGRLTPATEIADAARAGSVDCAQRRPEITPGYDCRSASIAMRSAGYALNEGRRLPPATTGDGLNTVMTTWDTAQRRPEITPGYDPREEKAPGGDRFRAQRRPEITPGYDARGPSGAARVWDAQRRPEITPGYDRQHLIIAPQIRSGAQRRPEITPGYDESADHGFPPAPQRSTKAGDYPRLRPGGAASATAPRSSTLNEGRRLPPATTPVTRRGRPVTACAQRRPEITPGYDARTAC